MSATPYQALRAQRQQRLVDSDTTSSRRVYPADVAKERSAEKTRRNVEARRRAWNVLALRYPDEFAGLLATERAGVDAERGPLPGDAVTP